MRKNHSSMSTFFSNQSLRQNPALKGVFELYIKPFVHFFLDRQMLEKNADIIDTFFHGGDRKILTACARTDFRMPGVYKQAALKHVKGVRYDVQSGDRLYIRIDRTMPQEIDVEAMRDKKTYVFRLTGKDFSRILKLVDIVER